MRKIQIVIIILAFCVLIASGIVLNTDKVWAINNCELLNCGQWPCGTPCSYENTTYWLHPYNECPNRPHIYPVWCTY